jgi:hypothetical protein
LPSSPWIRGAPQRGLASVIWLTSVRMAAVVLGRPGRVRVERWVQRRRSHWRCQRTTVSGCTTIKAVRHSGHALASRTQNSRSRVRSCGRLTERREPTAADAAPRSRARRLRVHYRAARAFEATRQARPACAILPSNRSENQLAGLAIKFWRPTAAVSGRRSLYNAIAPEWTTLQKLSLELSLPAAKTGPPEPTAANSLDLGSDSNARICGEKRRWPRGGSTISKPPPSASRPPHRER